jgi:hypothetical protein
MKKHYRKENDCLNCGAELQGKFCHVCGQENLQIKESFGHMMNHAISDYFHFDHQFFHTLKPLLFKPGKLTNEYMAGKRVQYLHPVKMYIFISLVYFVLLFQSGFEPVKVTHNDKDKKTEKKDLISAKKKLDSIAKSPNTNDLEKNILMVTQKKIDTAIKKGDTSDDDINSINKKSKRFHLFGNGSDEDSKDTTYQQYLVSQEKLPAGKRDHFFRKYIRKREYELSSNEKGVKAALTEGIKHSTPKMMFLLLPLFALLLKITFWKNKKYYVEHLIYSFHLHCFLFLFLTLIMLAQMVIPTDWHIVRDILYWFATLSVIWYIYRSLRVVYHRSSGRTITKMIGLTFSYTIVFSFCMLVLVVAVALFE